MVIGKYILILFFLFASNSCAEDNIKQCSENINDYNIFGTYVLKEHKMWVDGFDHIEDDKSYKYLGTKVILKPNYYQDIWKKIQNPKYTIKCLKIYKEEGNIPRRNYSYFDGFGADRDYIKDLTVYNKSGRAVAGFEIIDNNTLWIFVAGHSIDVYKKIEK